jgi:hypothetical protein
MNGRDNSEDRRPKLVWKGNIKMDLRKIEFVYTDSVYPGKDRECWRASLNTVMNLRVP